MTAKLLTRTQQNAERSNTYPDGRMPPACWSTKSGAATTSGTMEEKVPVFARIPVGYCFWYSPIAPVRQEQVRWGHRISRREHPAHCNQDAILDRSYTLERCW
jgi:hypothetical protein